MQISSDKNLNPRLAKEVQGVRGLLTQQAEKCPLPERFTVERHPDQPEMIFTDTETGKQISIAICHYQGVREFIAEMF